MRIFPCNVVLLTHAGRTARLTQAAAPTSSRAAPTGRWSSRGRATRCSSRARTARAPGPFSPAPAAISPQLLRTRPSLPRAHRVVFGAALCGPAKCACAHACMRSRAHAQGLHGERGHRRRHVLLRGLDAQQQLAPAAHHQRHARHELHRVRLPLGLILLISSHPLLILEGDDDNPL